MYVILSRVEGLINCFKNNHTKRGPDMDKLFYSDLFCNTDEGNHYNGRHIGPLEPSEEKA